MLKRMYVGVLSFFLAPLIEAQRNAIKGVRESDLEWIALRRKMVSDKVDDIDDRVSQLEDRAKKHGKHIDGLANRIGLVTFGDGFLGQSAIDERSANQKLNEALEEKDGASIIDILRNELAPRGAETEGQARAA